MEIIEFFRELLGDSGLEAGGITLPIYRQAIKFVLEADTLPPEMQADVAAYQEILAIWEADPSASLKDVLLEHTRQKMLSKTST